MAWKSQEVFTSKGDGRHTGWKVCLIWGIATNIIENYYNSQYGIPRKEVYFGHRTYSSCNKTSPVARAVIHPSLYLGSSL